MRRRRALLALMFFAGFASCKKTQCERQGPLMVETMTERLNTAVSELAFRAVDIHTIEYRFDEHEAAEETIDVGSLKIACGQEPADCADLSELFANAFFESLDGEPDEHDASNVRALLEVSLYASEVKEASTVSAAEELAGTVSSPFAGSLSVVYIFDSLASTAPVTRAEMRRLGLDEAALAKLAVDNMLEAFPGPIESELAHPPSTVHTVSIGDSYEAARLLLLSKWTPIADQFKGDIIASVPAPDTLLYVDSNVSTDVARLREIAEQLEIDSPNPLSSELFRFTGTGWQLVAATP